MLKVVHVKWKDPGFSESGWMSIASFKEWMKEGIVECESVGLLAYENEDQIVLVQSTSNDLIASALKINKAAIQSLTEIHEVNITLDLEDAD